MKKNLLITIVVLISIFTFGQETKNIVTDFNSANSKVSGMRINNNADRTKNNQPTKPVLNQVNQSGISNSTMETYEKDAVFAGRNPKDEVLERRDRTSKHFQNPDGSIEAILSTGSLNYLENDKWQTIERAITPNNTGKFESFEFANTKNAFKSFYGNTPVNGIKTIIDNQEITEWQNKKIEFYDANLNLIGFINAANSEININHAKANYANIFPHTEAQITQLHDGRKIDYEITSAEFVNLIPVNAVYLAISEDITLPEGWTAKYYIDKLNGDQKESKQRISIFNYEKEEILQYQPPVYFEKENRQGIDDPIGEYQISQNGQTLTIKTMIDASWIRDEERNFPVVIDPTVSVSPMANWTAQMGSSGVGDYGTIAVGYNGGYYRSYAKFDISSITDGSTVSSTILYHNVGSTSNMSTLRGSEIRAFLDDPDASYYSTWSSLYNAVTNSTVSPLIYQKVTHLGTLGWKNVTLGTNANTHLQNRLSLDNFTIGYRPSGTYNGTKQIALLYGSDHSNKPYLSVTYTAPSACSGTPTGGTASITPSSGTHGSSFTASVSGSTAATGITYQWESAPSSTGPWTAITSATLATYVANAPYSNGITYYRREITCTNTGGGTSYSSVTNFTTTCIPSHTEGNASSGGYGYIGITKVELESIVNTSGYYSTGSPSYYDYTSQSTDIETGNTYILKVTYKDDGSPTNLGEIGAWIDWNNDGDFSDENEFLGVKTGLSNNATASFNFNVPVGTSAGDKRMRVRSILNGDGLTSTDACTIMDYGETEDYNVNVLETVPIACAAFKAFTVSLGTPANGLNHHLHLSWDALIGATAYDVQYSTDGTNYTNANPAQSTTNSFDFNAGDNPDAAYWFKVRGTDGVTNCNWETIGPIYTAADVPEVPFLANAVGTSLDLSLQAETPVENPAHTTYSIYCTTTGQYVQANGTLGSTEVWQTKSAWGIININGLTTNTEYCFNAKAKNQDGHIVGGNMNVISQSFDSNVLTTGTSAGDNTWFAPNYQTPFTWNADYGCPSGGGGIGYSSNWNNSWGNFLRLPAQNLTGLDEVTMTFDLSNSYFASQPNDNIRFNMWAPTASNPGGTYISATKVNGVATDKLNFSELRSCESVSVTYNLSSVTDKSGIYFYFNATCGYNNSNVFYFQLDNISISKTAPDACITLNPAATPVFHNYGSASQLAFNNSRVKQDNVLNFRLSHQLAAATDYEIEINSASNFSGTSYIQTYNGTYPANTEHDFEFTNASGLLNSNNTTYYVKARIKTADGYGSWTSDTYSFTYNSNIESIEWYQQTTPQFLTDELDGTESSGDEVRQIISLGGGGNSVTNSGFSNGLTGWTVTGANSSNNSFADVLGSSDPICTSCNLPGANNLRMGSPTFGDTGPYNGSKIIVAQQIDLTDVNELKFDVAAWYNLGSPLYDAANTILKFKIGGTLTNDIGSELNITAQTQPSSYTFVESHTVTVNTSGITGVHVIKFVLEYNASWHGNGLIMYYISDIDAPILTENSGTITSTPFHLASIATSNPQFTELFWEQEIGGSLVLAMQHYNGTAWQNVSEFENISEPNTGSFVYDLLDMPAYDSVRVKGTLTGTSALKLFNWGLRAKSLIAVNAGEDFNVCLGNPIHLSETGGDAVSWSWSGPNGFTSTEQNPIITSATSANSGTYTVTITEVNGFTATDEVIVTVKPLPELTCPDEYKVCNQALPMGATNPTDFTNLGGTTNAASIGYVDGDPSTLGCTETTIRTYTATSSDACINTCTQNLLRIVDVTAPTIVGSLETINIQGCLTSDVPAAVTTVSALEALGLTIEDACTAKADLLVSSLDASAGTCPIVVTRTYTITDACSNSSTATQTINVEDKTIPTFTAPADITIYSDASCNYDIAVANVVGDVTNEADNCSTNLQATFEDAIDNTNPCNIVITRTWSLKDDCGNAAANQVQTITVIDTIAPTFTAPADVTIYTDTNCEYDVSVANVGDVTDETDNCSTNLQATFEDAAPIAITGCEGGYTIERTWSLVDDCGNAAANQIQTITIRDNTAPTFTAPVDITISSDENCNYDITVANVGDVTNEADNCSTDLQATFSDASPVPIVGGYTIARTWSLVDGCDNAAANQVQTITVTDNTAPTGTAPTGTANINACYIDATTPPTGTPEFDAADAASGYTDNCHGTVTATLTNTAVTGDNCAWTVTYTFKVADPCGNELENQTIQHTGGDKTAPTGTAPAGTANINACYIDATTPPTGTPEFVSSTVADSYSDNCGGEVKVTLTNTAVSGDNCAWTVTYTYDVTDICGNKLEGETIKHTGGDKAAPALTGTIPLGQTGMNDCFANIPVGPTEADIKVLYVDACGGEVTVSKSGTPSGTDCDWSVTYTYEVKDACNNLVNPSPTVTYSGGDNTAPTLSGVIPSGQTGMNDCFANIPVGPTEADIKALYVDACGGEVTVSKSGTPSGTDCDWSVTYTYEVKDACNNLVNPSPTVTYSGGDYSIPTFTAPADITIYSDASCNYDVSVANVGDVTDEADNCSTNLQATFEDAAPIAITGCEGGYTIERTWSLVDDCGNAAANQVQTITVIDTIAPTFTAPADVTIYTDTNCEYDVSVANVGDVTDEADNCSTNLQATFEDAAPIAITGCKGGYTIERTWSLVDDCGNAAANQIQTITIRDNTAPTFTAPDDITISSDENCNYDITVANVGDVTNEADNCSTDLQATFSDAPPVPIVGGYTIARTWSLVDSCGNTATDQVQTITVTDNTAPTGTAPTGTANIDACYVDATTPPTGTPAFDATVAASGYTDNCHGTVTATLTNTAVTGDNCAWTVTYTFKVADPCGNELENQTIQHTGGDKTAPTGTAPAGTANINACYIDATTPPTGTPEFVSSTVADSYSDNCGGEVKVTLTNTAVSGDNCAWTVTYTYDVTDICGNKLEGETIKHTGGDKAAPALTGTIPLGQTGINDCFTNIPVGPTEADIKVLYVDACGGEVTVSKSGTPSGTDCDWSVTYTYEVKDACNNLVNPSPTVTYSGGDNTAPTLSGVIPSGQTGMNDCFANIPVGPTEADIKALYVDACGGEVTVSKSGTPSGTDCDWSVTYTYEVKDACNNLVNPSPTVTYSGGDYSIPTFTAPANITIYSDASCNYDVSVANVGDVTDEADNCSTNLQATFEDAAPIAITGCEGGYTIERTWSLVDDCGNAAANQIQTITIRDNTAPTFTAPADITIYSDASCNYDIAVANVGDVTDEADNCSTNLQATFEDAAPIAITGCKGGYTIERTWSLVDDCGNAAANQIQTITIRDNTAPTFTAPVDITISSDENCNYDITVANVGDVTNEADNCSTDLQATFSDASPVPIVGGYTIARTWSLVDGCDNAAANQVQTITVTDNTAPTGTAPTGTANINACYIDATTPPTGTPEFDAADAASGYTDNCHGTVTATLTNTAVTGDNCAWTVTYTFKVADPCGNELENQTIQHTGGDKTAPTGTAPAGTANINACYIDATTPPTGTPEFDATVAASGYTDNCNGTVTATLTNTVVSGDNCAWTVTYTYDVTDICGNKLEGETIKHTGGDKTAPALTGTIPLGQTGMNDCFANIPVGPTEADIKAQYADACGGDITVTKSEAITGTDCSWNVIYTYEVKDACGNIVNPSPTVTYSGGDNTEPVLTGVIPSGQTGMNDCFANIPVGPTEADIKAQYADACGGDITVTKSEAITGTDCSWSVTYTYEVKDACGNIVNPSPTVTYSGGDNTAPTLSGVIPSGQTGINDCIANIPVGPTEADIKAQYADACGGDITVTKSEAITGTDCSWSVTYTYEVKDACGNIVNPSPTVTYSGGDNTAPTLSGVIPSGQTGINDCIANIPVGPTEADIKAQYADACGGDITVTKSEAITGTDCSWSVTYTYEVKDACGNIVNPSPTVTYSGGDNTAPTLSGVIPSGQTGINDCIANIPVGPTEADIKAQYADACGGDITVTKSEAITGTDCSWSVTYTYEVKDACGNIVNPSPTVTYSGGDNTAPTLSGVIPSGQTGINDCIANIPVGPTEADIKAQYADACGGDITVTKSEAITGTDCSWSVTYTYEVKDACGNIVNPSPTVTYSGGDNTAPTLSGVIPSGQTGINDCIANIPVGPTEADIKAQYADACGGDITVTKSEAITGTDCSWSVTYTYEVKDACGNIVESTPTVIYSGGDNSAPTLSGVIPSGQTGMNDCFANIPVGPTEADIKALYVDACGGEVTVSKSGTPSGTDCDWSVTYTYEVKDACGNIVEPSPTVTYSGGDITNPVITGTIEDQAATSMGVCVFKVPDVTGLVSVTDNCTETSQLIISQSPLVGAEVSENTQVTISVEDQCGNFSSTFVNVTVHIPTVNAGENFAVCKGESINLSASSEDAVSWSWSGPNSFSSTEQNPIITSTTSVNAGIYTVTIMDANGCTATDQVDVVVNEPVSPAFSFATEYCLGSTASELPLTSDNSITGTWNPAEIATNNAGQVDYVFTPTIGQCASQKIVTVLISTPATNNVINGDFVWSGNTSVDWNTPSNWLIFNNENYAVASTLPTPEDNVFLRTYGTDVSCVSNAVIISSAPDANTKKITIESGNTLTMAAEGNPILNVYGSWSNAGTFNAGLGTVIFKGTGTQIINSDIGSFNNITFNNNDNIEIIAPITIDGKATFTNGIVYYTEQGSLTFGNLASSNIGNANSFVNGIVSKTGTSAFNFAIGQDNNWGPCAIAAPVNPSTITAQYLHSAGPNNWNTGYMCSGSGLHHVSGIEHWELTSDADHPAVTLYWSSLSGVVNTDNLTVAHSDGVCWNNKGGNVSNGSNETSGSITSTVAFNSYSPITLGTTTNQNPLPVVLAAFEVVCENAAKHIHWTTLTEVNNQYFTLEKSENGVDFKFLAQVQGEGNSNQIKHYHYLDTDLSLGVAYYRLIQTDFDGQEKVYGPVSSNCEKVVQDFNLLPNPNKGNFQITASSSMDKQVVLLVFDVQGRAVYQKDLNFQKGNNSIEINAKLNPGVYMVHVKDDRNSYMTVKMVVMN